MKHADIVFDTDLSFGSIEDNSSFELEDPTESRRYTATFGELKTYDESIKKFILKLSKIIPVVPEVLVSEIHFFTQPVFMVSDGFGSPEGLVPRPGGRSRPDDEVGFEGCGIFRFFLSRIFYLLGQTTFYRRVPIMAASV